MSTDKPDDEHVRAIVREELVALNLLSQDDELALDVLDRVDEMGDGGIHHVAAAGSVLFDPGNRIDQSPSGGEPGVDVEFAQVAEGDEIIRAVPRGRLFAGVVRVLDAHDASPSLSGDSASVGERPAL